MKFRTSARLCSLALILFFLASFAAAQQRDKENVREGHKPRTRSAQQPAQADREVDADEDGDRENPVGREQWFMRGRTSQGQPAPQLLIRAQRQREQLRLRNFQARQLKAADRALKPNVSSNASFGWMELGPSPLRSVTTTGDNGDYGLVTGRVTAVAVDQGDPSGNTVYVGGAYGGVWKSTTAANPDPTKVVWKPVTDDQATLAIGAIAVSPADSNLLLVGTGEANSSSDSYYGLGILRSTDAGNSWSLITSANNGLRPFHGLAFAKIAFKSDNPSIIVAATAAASQGITVGAEQPANNAAMCANSTATATCRGLYYSYDSGQTWNQAAMIDNTSTNAAPDNGSASDVLYNPQEQLWYAFSRAHGMYTSADGITFTRAADQGTASGVIIQPASGINLTNCPSSPPNLTTCPTYRAQITQVPGRDEMYVWFVDSSSTPVDGGIYRTTDGGKTWTTLNRATIDTCGDSNGCGTQQGDYNLVLTAVPNGQGTDLYAGAVNIYRCQITSNNSTCTTNPFINLTHVYGCTPTGSFSNVHPDQHSFDFSVSNPSVIYFGNDGGIYRTVASENGATVPSSCQGSAPAQPYYPFDNLNGTMGSMTQFVWFQQHPTNQFTMLGGTQDNGSPAIDSTNSGGNGITWRSVLGGDGGWTDINPNNANEWFTENTKVSIHRCASGTSCTDSAFGPVISSNTVGGDSAAFYMPYMLDQQNTSQIILGTCRVWRVGSSGSSPTALSPKFDGSTAGAACASTSTSFVNALAAGGPKTTNGSQVIYAGTADGHIWVTTSADTGTSSWAQRDAVQGGFQETICATAGTCQYPVSGFAIDPRDTTGNTAYVTAMGFGIGHIWKTTNAGTSWNDISGTIGSGGLPDSPADGVAIDPATGNLYVGTDVGVYATSSVSGLTTQWTEVGPATGAGTLPNVAITRVAIFNPSGQPPLLRVSTYGRGIWQTPLPASITPDYALSVASPDLEAFPGQSVTYSGTETALNGYTGSVTLSCNASGGTLPSTCNASAVSSGTFTVMASNAAVQDFSFRVQGTDGTLVRFAPLTLRVVDFAVSAPSPVTGLVHGSSANVALTLSGLGSFDRSVTIDCDPATLPTGMTCTASPVTPPAGGSAQVTVTVNTTLSTLASTYNLTLRAISTIDSTHSIQHTQPLSVQVIAKPGFVVDSSSYTAQSLAITQPLQTTLNLSPHDGYTGTVAVGCSAAGSGIPSTACSFSLSQGGAPVSSVSITGTNPVPVYVSVDTSAGTAGNWQLVITASDSSQSLNAQATLAFSLSDFTLNVASAPATVAPGTTAKLTYTLVPLNGYNQSVNLSCDTSTLAVPCTFTPSSTVQLVPGQTATVTASFVAPTNAQPATVPITLSATGSVATSLKHSQVSNVQVTSAPDFSITGSTAATTNPGGTTILSYTVASLNQFSGTVSLSCSSSTFAQPISCNSSPVQLTAGQSATATVSFTLPSSQAVGAYTVMVAAQSGTITHSQTVSVQVQDFTPTISKSSDTVKAGGTTTATLNFQGSGGFNGNVNWTVFSGCSAAAEMTCTISPTSTSAGASATLTVTTKAPSVSGERTGSGTLAFWIGLPFGTFGLVLLKRKKGIALATLLMLIGLAACGGGGGSSSQPPPVTDPGTPAGTYSIVIAGTAGPNVHNQIFTLTVQ